MRLAAAALCMTFVAAQAGSAAAQPSRTPPSVPPPYSYQPPPPGQPLTHTERYGKTIAAVDAVSFGAVFLGAIVFAVSLASDNGSDGDAAVGAVMMVGGAVGLIAGGPIVHLEKHNSSGAWKSLALRLGLPVLGSLVGMAIDGKCDPQVETCDQNAQGSLGGLGLIGAMVIDWVWLAKHTVTTYAAPTYGGGATFGLEGHF